MIHFVGPQDGWLGGCEPQFFQCGHPALILVYKAHEYYSYEFEIEYQPNMLPFQLQVDF